MNIVRRTGWLLIVGFFFILVGALVAPQEAYIGELSERLDVIRQQNTRWLWSKVFDAFGAALPGIAFAMLSWKIADRQSRPGMARFAGWLMAFSAILAIYYVYLLTTDPGRLWVNGFPEPLSFLFIIAYLVAFLLLLFSISERITPPWVFYLSAPVAVLALLVAVVFREQSPFYLFAILSALNAVIGIPMLRSDYS